MEDVLVEPASPAPLGHRWRLAELVSIETLQSIQDTFARAFGLPTVIVDPDGEPATQFTNRLRFCEDLTRSTQLGGERCSGCQAAARADAAATCAPSIYHCWNGLYDAAIPIAPKGDVVGYFLCGQVFAAPPNRTTYSTTAEEIGADPDEYVAGLDDVRIMTFEQYEASVRSMHVLATLISDQAAAAIDNLAVLEQVREAEQNAAERVAEAQVVLDSLRELGRRPERRRTLEALGDGVLRLLACDICALYVPDDSGKYGAPDVIRPPGAVAAQLAAGLDLNSAAGEPRHFVDLRTSRHAVMVPVIRDGRSVGMLVASRAHRPFSPSELEAVAVLGQQAATSLELFGALAELEARERRERVLTQLLEAAAHCDETAFADHVALTAVELLGAEGAVVLAGEATAASVGVGADETSALRAVVSGARPNDGSVFVQHVSAAGVPFHIAAVRHDQVPWDAGTGEAVAALAAIALESVRARDRLERAAVRDKRFAELVSQLSKAADVEDVERALLEHTAAVVSADVAAVVSIDDELPGTARLRAADEGGVVETAIALEGAPRVAAVRLSGGRQPRAVFEAWAAESLAALSSLARTEQHLAEPVQGREGTYGAVVCAWRAGTVRPPLDETRRLLKLVAHSAAGALARFRAPDGTHAELRARVDQLEAVARLAGHLADAADEAAVLDALIEVASHVGQLDGAFFAVTGRKGWTVRHVAGLGTRAVAEGLRAATDSPAAGRAVRVPLTGGTEAVVVATRDRACLLVGRRRVSDGRLDDVLPRLLDDAASALARVTTDKRRQAAVERLESERAEATDLLERAGRGAAARDAMALAALDGLDALVAELVAAIGGVGAIVAADGRELARAGGDGRTPQWRPPALGARAPRARVQRQRGRQTVAAPGTVGGEALAWVVSEDADEDATLVRAAVEHAALLAASAVLRERTVLEVEMRMRGGFVDDLCTRREPDETLLARGRTLGIDLAEPSRVLLVERSGDPGEPSSRHEDELLYEVASECARAWPKAALVASRRGGIAVVFAESEGERFEDCLRATLDARCPGASFAIAVGTACRTIGDYAASEAAARHALELMPIVGRAGQTFSFRDETFETLLLQATDPAALVRFVDRYVQPLDRVDQGRSIELRRTLETYFACGRNLEQTARALHVHVSTLRYRLTRACAAAGVEPKDERAMLDLQLALAVLATLTGNAGARNETFAGSANESREVPTVRR